MFADHIVYDKANPLLLHFGDHYLLHLRYGGVDHEILPQTYIGHNGPTDVRDMASM
ncbi:hypothetical protein MBAV_005287 [Candidatus Magnetobacterium bavaricum]|uniref:Uncharacterized protein n=1 Tax=Candidatus Magnetobacterium bavaricum TaxID=29290 RepID=A0A0F3GKR8_9BACT|nr:hypothetical protein MBAV_005287 [Candidatus Magnetobacterium bavaricum]